MSMKHNIITLITIFCLYNLFAVINTYESSHTIMKKIDTPFESIMMDKINLEALFEEDENNIGRFSCRQQVKGGCYESQEDKDRYHGNFFDKNHPLSGSLSSPEKSSRLTQQGL